MTRRLTRRDWLHVTSASITTAMAAETLATSTAHAASSPQVSSFAFCLNTSTLQGQKLTIEQELQIASEVGYQGVEPWIRELEQYEQSGKSLEDLGKRLRDLGLVVPSAIGFFEWAVDDDARRRQGMEDARRSMELVRRIGGLRLAAPPVGVTDRSDVDLRRVAERYRALLEIGSRIGVIPEVEVWGFSKTLGRLSEAAFVAIEADHPDACILPDVFHLYKGGSGLAGVKLLGPNAIHVFHMNDYPAMPPRAEIADKDRVYPGDGVAPLNTLIENLRSIGFHGMLSLEVFNRDYWAQDPRQVARTGLEKMKRVVQSGTS